MRRYLRLAGMLAVVALVSSSGATGSSDGAWTLRVAIGQDVELDPTLAYLYDPIANLTCAKLLNFTSERHLRSSRLYPEVATAFPRVSRDRKTYTFTLRRGFRFSDGTPVTAANYAAAFRRLRDPAMRSPDAVGFPDVAHVAAEGRRLIVTLTKPAGDFVARVAGFSFVCPIPTDLPVTPEGVDLLVRSGPYYIADYRPNREIVLRRNPFYPRPRGRAPATIDVTIGLSELEMADAVQHGELDYELTYGELPPDVARRLLRTYGLGRRLLRVPLLKTYFLGFNNSRPLLRGNVALRKAINLAVDRPAVLRSFGESVGAQVTDQLLPPAMPGSENADLYPLHGPKVRRAVSLARGHLRVGRAVLVTTSGRTAAAHVIQDDLARIGLHVDIQTLSDAVYLQRIQSRRAAFDLTIGGWVADYPDPGNFFVSLARSLPWVRIRAFSRATSANKLTGPSRYPRFGRLDVDLLRRQAWIAPLFNPVGYAFVSRRIGCVRFGPATPGDVDLSAVCLRRS